MATVKLDIEVNGLSIYVTPTGLRTGSKGSVLPAAEWFSQHDKGLCRRVRKACRKVGLSRLACVRRIVD